jgi:hypothetical protein
MAENGNAGAKQGGAAEEVVSTLFKRKSDMYVHGLFYALLAYTALIVWFATCEMLASAPGLADWAFVHGKHLPQWLVTYYPCLIGGYGGVREFRRWKEFKHDDSDMIAEAQQDAQVITREFVILIFWLVYGFIVAVADGNVWIKTVPDPVVYIMTQTIIVLTGAHVSHSFHKDKMLRSQKAAGIGKFAPGKIEFQQAVTVEEEPEPDTYTKPPKSSGHLEPQLIPLSYTKPAPTAISPAGPASGDASRKNVRISDAHKQMVLKYLETSEWINSEGCQNLTQLSPDQTYRLLSGMEEDGVLGSEGIGRAKRYRLKIKPK